MRGGVAGFGAEGESLKQSLHLSAGMLARYALLALVVSFLLTPGWAMEAEPLDLRDPAEIPLYLTLAHASARSYDDAQPGLRQTPSGCVALIEEDDDGNLIIAFRGSMLGDRNPKHRFSTFGGANIRRNYRDWVATNLKQTAGFLPRQYVEAAALVAEQVRAHPSDKLVYITGHSKGGGAAAYAYVAARINPAILPEQSKRMHCVTFNAAVVTEQNWRRLFRQLDRGIDPAEAEPPPGSIRALVMADDPVSKINMGEERKYVRRIVIEPTTDLTATEQHGIEAVIAELGRRVR